MRGVFAIVAGGSRIEALQRGWIAKVAGDEDPSVVSGGAERPDDFIGTDSTFLFMASEIASKSARTDHIPILLQRLVSYGDPEFIGGHVGVSYLGPTSRARGLLLARMGDLTGAERALREALDRVRANRFTPWVARIESELRGLEGAPAPAPTTRVESDGVPVGAGSDASVVRNGDIWTIRARGREVRVADNRGMRLLARLIARPDEEMHVLALASDHEVATVDSDAGETIDAEAAKAYRARLKVIESALTGAGAPVAERLRAERDALQRELSSAFGQKGARRQKSTSERARVNVQRRLKDAFRRIAEVDPDLGRYFERAVRTGTYCCFRP
jgi:hypothetical protein